MLGEDMPENDERQEYVRATAQKDDDGNLVIHPFNSQDSSMLANLVRADCLLIRDIRAMQAKAGDECRVVMLR
jgi:molybdopterin molybdotransferase